MNLGDEDCMHPRLAEGVGVGVCVLHGVVRGEGGVV